MLLFVLTRVAPNTKCSDLGSKFKGEVRDGFRRGLGKRRSDIRSVASRPASLGPARASLEVARHASMSIVVFCKVEQLMCCVISS